MKNKHMEGKDLEADVIDPIIETVGALLFIFYVVSMCCFWGLPLIGGFFNG